MSRIRSKNTKAELILRRRLHQRGLRYRVHACWLPGTPDVAFTRRKVAIFVDGDFWHGRDFSEWQHKLQPYWREKIANNRERDRRQEAELEGGGWTILRFWERDVKKDPDSCIDRVLKALDTLA